MMMTRCSRSVRRRRGVRPRRGGVNAASLALLAALCVLPGAAPARSLEADVARLLEISCLRCHDVETETPLDLENLGYDLEDRGTFRKWVRVFERLEAGEMPPRGTRPPPRPVVEAALGALERDLETADMAARTAGQAAPRRLTGLEYEYTLEDLLLIEENLARLLPAESASAGFDTLAAEQGISALHLRSYLEAADRALDAAIRLGGRPASAAHLIDYPSNPASYRMIRQSVSRKLDDAVAMFVDEDHHNTSGSFSARNLRSDSPRLPGHAFGAVQGDRRRLSLPGVDACDAPSHSGQPERRQEVARRLRPGERVRHLRSHDLPPPDRLCLSPKWPTSTGTRRSGASTPPSKTGRQRPRSWLRGRAWAGGCSTIGSITRSSTTPPRSSWMGPRPTRARASRSGRSQSLDRSSMRGRRRRRAGSSTASSSTWPADLKLTKDPYEHVVDVVSHFVPLAFRRPAEAGEVDAFASLSKPAIAAGREFVDAVRVPLRAVLSAPQFLYHDDQPGKARRLRAGDPPFVLPVEEPAGRGALRRGTSRHVVGAGGAGAAGRENAR